MTVTDTRGGSRYTHRDWKHETGQVLLVIAAAEKALEVMEASLAEVRAGNTHMTLVRQCQVRGAEILRSGLDLVDATDQRYLPVHEAIAAAGGKDEVAHVKTYHQA